MKLRVFRSGPPPRYDTWVIPESPGQTVLSALFHVKETADDSLSFRYSCRGAVCGTCAVSVNRVPRLACRTRTAPLPAAGQPRLAPFRSDDAPRDWDPGKEILVEPLPHLPVIRDLVVDMKDFFGHYRVTGPVLHPRQPLPEREFAVSPDATREIGIYANCILCASCVAACPVCGRAPEFLGPAALAKLYRFSIDPRDAGGSSALSRADLPAGWWECEFHGNCTKVCPKGVPPSLAIGRAQRTLSAAKKTRDKDESGSGAGSAGGVGRGGLP